MADPRYIAQVSIKRLGLAPEDDVVNTMHFEGDPDTGGNDRARWDTLAPGLSSRLVTFYQALNGAWAEYIAPAGHTIKLYDFADPKPRIPRVITEFALVPGSGSMPAEVAICLSMRAALLPGVNPARRRGRIFLGPFNSGTAVKAYVAGQPDVSIVSAFQTTILNAAKVMAKGTNGAARLAVYSPTTHALTPGDAGSAFHDVTDLWVDNGFDTVRSRGRRATLRTTATV